MSSSVRAPDSAEALRSAAHDVANVLCSSDIGGECYLGGKHTCFIRQGRKPLSLYKVVELCERCAATWHAVMAAALLDSVVIGQQFLGGDSVSVTASVGVVVHGKAVPGRHKLGAENSDLSFPVEILAIVPNPAGRYTSEERRLLAKFYQSAPRAARSAFNARFHVKAWQMRDWAK